MSPCNSLGSPQTYTRVSLPSPAVPDSVSGTLSGIEIPKHWRPETEACITQKCLTAEARNDIVRTLITLTIGKIGFKPSKSDCQIVARKLILSYPFMTDDFGNGYVSENEISIMHFFTLFILMDIILISVGIVGEHNA